METKFYFLSMLHLKLFGFLLSAFILSTLHEGLKKMESGRGRPGSQGNVVKVQVCFEPCVDFRGKGLFCRYKLSHFQHIDYI